jgi:CBS domain-containing protein
MKEEHHMHAGTICTRTVVTATAEETVEDAAKRMAQYAVGTLVVMENQTPIGIVTDRDLVIRVLAQQDAQKTSPLRAVMSTHLIRIPEHTPLEDALVFMRGYQVRRLLVVNDAEELVGIMALDDILALLGPEQAEIGALLGRYHEEIAGMMRAKRADQG